MKFCAIFKTIMICLPTEFLLRKIQHHKLVSCWNTFKFIMPLPIQTRTTLVEKNCIRSPKERPKERNSFVGVLLILSMTDYRAFFAQSSKMDA
jgi:hypothetical protein